MRLIFGMILEELGGLLDGHLEDVVDVLAAVADLERLVVEALAAAVVADDLDVRQELHRHRLHAGARAALAATAVDVEGEAPLRVQPRAFASGTCAKRSRMRSKTLV